MKFIVAICLCCTILPACGEGTAQEARPAGDLLTENSSPAHDGPSPDLGRIPGNEQLAGEAKSLFDEALVKSMTGDKGAQCRLGDFFRYGFGIEPDYHEAMKWYRRAAEQGDMSAQCNLGTIYLFGLGRDRDFAKALDWLSRAAEKGSAQANGYLAMMYLRSYGVKDNQAAAFRLLSSTSGDEGDDDFDPQSIPWRPIGIDNYGRFPDKEATLISP